MNPSERAVIYERDRGLCGFCGQPVPWAEFEVDHVPPRALGLPTQQLRASHRLCNRRGGSAARQLLHQPADTVGYLLRLRPALKAKLAAVAKANRRSLNSEIVYRLQQSRQADERRRHRD